MNPASRLSEFVTHLNDQKDSVKLIDAYKSFIGSNDDYAVWRTMRALQEEERKIRSYTLRKSEDSGYQELHDALKPLIYPNAIRSVQISQLKDDVKTARLMLAVLKDTLDYTYLYENDVTDRIDALKESLEYFIENLDGLPSDPYVARMYVRVSLKLKEALEMYRITGIDGIREALAAFDCVFDDNVKGKTSLIDKAKAAVDAAKTAKEAAAITFDLSKLLGY